MIIHHSVTGEPLVFEINFETGEVSGAGADAIMFFIERDGGIASFPQQFALPAPDPLHSERDLARMLASRGYVIPDEWMEHLPEIESEEGIIY